MTRPFLLALALCSLAVPAMTGCDAGFVPPAAFSSVDDGPLRLTLYDTSGDVVTTGEVDFDQGPQPGRQAEGTYRLDAPGVGAAQSGDLSAAYFVADGDCADRLEIRFDPRTADAGLELVTSCETSELRGEWYEGNIQGRQVRGTFVLE